MKLGLAMVNKIAVFVCLGLSVSLILFYALTTTVPLGEKSRSFDEYGGEFTLQGPSGEVSLSDFGDKVVVVYFGYLSCTEACPPSMGVIATAFERLSATELDQAQGLFISVDPERDELSQLTEFTQYYHSSVLGLIGTQAQVTQVTRQYGVYYDRIELNDSAMEYALDHVSRFYVIDKQGKLVTAMSHSTTPNELVAQITELL